MKLALLFFALPMATFGMDRLAALSMIETGNNDYMVGRAGEISRYQILKREWRSVTNSTRYTDPVTAKAVALVLVEKRTHVFQVIRQRPPTNFEFYALWNAPGQVMNQHLSRQVVERCRRFVNLCARDPKPLQVTQLSSRPRATPL